MGKGKTDLSLKIRQDYGKANKIPQDYNKGKQLWNQTGLKITTRQKDKKGYLAINATPYKGEIGTKCTPLKIDEKLCCLHFRKRPDDPRWKS